MSSICYTELRYDHRAFIKGEQSPQKEGLVQMKKAADKSPFSLRLTSMRKARDMTQEDVAEKLELNRSTYTCYETGTSMPGIDKLMAIADLYEVSVDYLLGRAGALSDGGQVPEEMAVQQEEQLDALEMLDMYRRMTADRKKIIKQLMKELANGATEG